MSGYMFQGASKSGSFDPSVYQQCRDAKEHPLMCAGYTDFFKNSNHYTSVNEGNHSSSFQYVRCAGEQARRDTRGETSQLIPYRGTQVDDKPVPTGNAMCGGAFASEKASKKKPLHRA